MTPSEVDLRTARDQANAMLNADDNPMRLRVTEAHVFHEVMCARRAWVRATAQIPQWLAIADMELPMAGRGDRAAFDFGRLALPVKPSSDQADPPDATNQHPSRSGFTGQTTDSYG
jgi:hypothetical protein